MKKNSVIILLFIAFNLSWAQKITAQTVENLVSPAYLNNDAAIGRMISTVIAPIIKGSEINPRALKNFSRSYKNVSGVSWIKINDGYTARFTLNGVPTIVFFDTRGNWTGSIENYSEDNMPKDVRHLVKSTYYDYEIDYLKVIKTATLRNTSTYFVGLEDQNEYKIIRIQSGEMEEWDEYSKAR